ncbi:polysaccharide deacetylase family protein [Rhodovulum sulfidophilum]|uniref:polysaccharide deacetylase family protein n=1 Tax=Rhodovulum sulfidophilum TaxID=35806 RepID=UPI001EEE350F|nr:polysaccharide deacetylase family protein [Rhodovulum sulfidophilum]
MPEGRQDHLGREIHLLTLAAVAHFRAVCGPYLRNSHARTLDFDAMLLRRLLNEPWGQKAKGEFGGRVGVWRIMKMFDTEDVKVTLFTPGRICELYPEVLHHAVDNGHELADHMWEHEVYDDPQVEDAHLTRTLEALSRIAGKPVTGTRSSHTPGLLRSKGVVYNSFTSADDLPFYELDAEGENPILQLPFHYALDDAMYFSFGWLDTGNQAQRIMDVDEVFEIWWDAFLQQYKAGGYVNFLLHPFVSGHAMRVAHLAWPDPGRGAKDGRDADPRTRARRRGDEATRRRGDEATRRSPSARGAPSTGSISTAARATPDRPLPTGVRRSCRWRAPSACSRA